MVQKPLRLAALLTALALLLTACTAGKEGADLSGVAPSAADASAGQPPEEDAVLAFAPAPEAEPKPEPEPEPEPGPRLTPEDMEQALEQVMERYSAAGVTVAAVENGQLSQAGAWGWAVKGEREMTPDTKIRIASISKVAVAMCTMAMAEDGLLELDAPISAYWGSGAVNPYSKNQPTVQDFMTHTSSLKDLGTIRGLSSLRSLLQSKSSWRSMEPGDGGYWYYNNSAISILGTTLELAADQVLDDYLQERLLKPLGIRASFYASRLEADELANIYQGGSMGFSISQQRFGTYTEIGRSAALYPGGFFVSAVDMAKLVSVLANDGVYKKPVYTYYEITDANEKKDVEYVMVESQEAAPTDGKVEYVMVESQEAGPTDGKVEYVMVESQETAPTDGKVEYVIVESQESSQKDNREGVEYIIAVPKEGEFEELRLLSEESVENIETPRFQVDLDDYTSFEQCLILRRQENVLGQEVLYYHTGSAYGVYSLMTYNPVTRNGVVVITTGTPRNMNKYGMYALCYDLMELLYEKMEADPR